MSDDFQDRTAHCIFCDMAAPAHLRQRIGCDVVQVCELCASAGLSALDAGTMLAALSCLHLVALEIERQFDPQFSRQRRALSRLRANFGRGLFRLSCACPTCSDWQAGFESDADVDFYADETFFSDDEGNLFVTDIPELSDAVFPLWILRTMSPRDRVPLPNGKLAPPDRAVPIWLAHNRAVTEVPPDVESRMSDIRGGVPAPDHFQSFGVFAARLADFAASKDAASARHWALVKKYGHGFRDGAFWVNRDGVAISLSGEECIFPMSAHDLKTLDADRARAAAWRASLPKFEGEGDL